MILKGIVLVSHHIDFHGLEPLSRQKNAPHKEFFVNTFVGFSYIQTIIIYKNVVYIYTQVHCLDTRSSVSDRESKRSSKVSPSPPKKKTMFYQWFPNCLHIWSHVFIFFFFNTCGFIIALVEQVTGKFRVSCPNTKKWLAHV